MEVHKKDIDIKGCISLNFTVLKMFGLWLPSRYRHTSKEFLYWLHSAIFLGLFFYSFVLSEIIQLFMVWGDLKQTVNASLLILTHGAQAVKTFNTLRWHSRIKRLIATLDDPIFNRVDIKSHHHVQYSMLCVKVMTRVYIYMSIVTICLWCTFPLLENSDVTRLPFAAWYPFDSKISPRFELLYLHQFLGTLINAWCNVSQDTIATGFMTLAAGQLDVLYDKLSDQHHRLTRPRGNFQEWKGSFSMEYEKHLVECIDHHKEIIRFILEVETLFGPGVLAQFFASSIIVCVTAFQITLLPFSLELFAVTLYLGCMLMELFLYCYFGNEMTIKSMRVREAVYQSVWYEHSLQSRKLIVIMMERSKRPLRVTAGIFTLSLETFTSILRSSYSYFAVLRQVNSEEGPDQ